jgi:methionyl-tRNA formyltransferase
MNKKIAFFGTPGFVTEFLDVLEQHDLRPSLVVTNPDRPVGRGMTMTAPEPKAWASERDIAVLQPEKIDAAFMEELSKSHWDLLVVIAYGHIMPEALINLPAHGTINVHYSLLPKYRGATPVEAAILNGDHVTGIAIQQMHFALDSGPILAQEEVAIADDDTTVSLRHKLNTVAVSLLPKVVADIFNGNAHATPQHEDGVSITKKIKKGDGELSLSNDAITNYRTYRAYKDNPGVYFYTERHDKRLRVKITKAAYDGDFVIEEVVPENGKHQSYQDFLHSLH